MKLSTFGAFLYSVFPLTPLPLSLKILSPGVTLGTPIALALLVRCFATIFYVAAKRFTRPACSNLGSPSTS